MATQTVARADAEQIWQAAINAVDPQRLLAAAPADLLGPLPAGRVVVVGAGKAAAGMAAGIAANLRQRGLPPERLAGLVSVPAGCGRRIERIEVRQARPAGANLPTPQVVTTTAEMLVQLGSLGPDDLAVALITGGGSALLAAPRVGVTLEDKIAVARFLSARGAGIVELNTVRRAASAVKAGGLARASTAGRLMVLVLSDVIGDPLDLIASGPCMPTPANPQAALDVLQRFGAIAAGIAPRLVDLLNEDIASGCCLPSGAGSGPDWTTPFGCHVEHRIVGNNDTAVDAAVAKAQRLGYEVSVQHALAGGGPETHGARVVGIRLAAQARALARATQADRRLRAGIEGGEATVALPPDHGLGGRNQQTVLETVVALEGDWPAGLVVASVGTDGEDGPTDAAGGVIDAAVAAHLGAEPQAASQAISRCDSLPLLERAGGLIRTGPTGTNVADVRIVLVRP